MKIRRERQGRHAETTFHNNLNIMVSALRQFEKTGFIQNINLKSNLDPLLRSFIIEGDIWCRNNIVVDVSKELKVISDIHKDEHAIVQTVAYAYYVRIKDTNQMSGYRNLFGYDNRAHHMPPHGCHSDPHHYHEYDTVTGKLIKGKSDCDHNCGRCPTWIGINAWPHLGDVVEQAEDWELENC